MFSQLGVSLVSMLLRPAVITSILLLIVGLSVSFLSNRITRAVRKTDKVSSDDKLLLTLKVIGLVIMIVGLIVMIFSCIWLFKIKCWNFTEK